MKSAPRFLPILLVVAGGALALRALVGVQALPELLAAAEAKVDTKLKQLTGLKGDIQGLLGQADAKKEAEMARLVTIYEQMPPAAAAQRMTLLDDSVRLPLASKMNVRKLSAILA